MSPLHSIIIESAVKSVMYIIYPPLPLPPLCFTLYCLIALHHFYCTVLSSAILYCAMLYSVTDFINFM